MKIISKIKRKKIKKTLHKGRKTTFTDEEKNKIVKFVEASI